MNDIFQGKRVLFVEDEPLVAMMVEEVLESYGAAVTQASSIEEAMAALDSAVAMDAAVLDINLRGHLSWPVVEALRERGVPFVIATGYGETMRAQALDAPFLPKPYSVADLLARLQELFVSDRRSSSPEPG